MGSYLRIDGGLVRQIEETVTKEATLEDVFGLIETRLPVTIPVLPRSCVFIHWDESKPGHKEAWLLCEIPAGMKNLIKSPSKTFGNGADAKRYRLAMPWTYIWFYATTSGDPNGVSWSLEDYFAYHSQTRFTGPDHPMIVARLPNIDTAGKICWGTTAAPISMSLADRLDTLVNGWFLSKFNSDLESMHVTYPYHDTSYRRWVNESKEDPNCWAAWPEWNESIVTVRKLLGSRLAPRQEMIVTDEISPVAMPFTFGRAEEWLRSIAPEHRARLSVALSNMQADDPALVPTMMEVDTSDDGGILLSELEKVKA